MTLAGFSTAELLAELQRRARDEPATPEFQPCERCNHFKPVESDAENPCSRGHTMRFVMPGDHNWPETGEWGFTRTRCADRCIQVESDSDPVRKTEANSVKRRRAIVLVETEFRHGKTPRIPSGPDAAIDAQRTRSPAVD